MTIAHDTIHLSRRLDADLVDVWAAYADTAHRSRWSVPEGEEMVFDADDLRSGGSARYRCGTPGELQFAGSIDYLHIAPEAEVVHTEIMRTGSELLSAGLLTWTFRAANPGTELTVTVQVTSFVGEGMLDGARNGHRIALDQLAALLRR